MTLRNNPFIIPAYLTEDPDIYDIVTEVSRILHAPAGVVVRSVVHSSKRTVECGNEGHILTRTVYVVEVREPIKGLPDGLQWMDIGNCSISYSPPDGKRLINEELRIMATKRVPAQRLSFFRPRGL